VRHAEQGGNKDNKINICHESLILKLCRRRLFVNKSDKEQ